MLLPSRYKRSVHESCLGSLPIYPVLRLLKVCSGYSGPSFAHCAHRVLCLRIFMRNRHFYVVKEQLKLVAVWPTLYCLPCGNMLLALRQYVALLLLLAQGQYGAVLLARGQYVAVLPRAIRACWCLVDAWQYQALTGLVALLSARPVLQACCCVLLGWRVASG